MADLQNELIGQEADPDLVQQLSELIQSMTDVMDELGFSGSPTAGTGDKSGYTETSSGIYVVNNRKGCDFSDEDQTTTVSGIKLTQRNLRTYKEQSVEDDSSSWDGVSISSSSDISLNEIRVPVQGPRLQNISDGSSDNGSLSAEALSKVSERNIEELPPVEISMAASDSGVEVENKEMRSNQRHGTDAAIAVEKREGRIMDTQGIDTRIVSATEIQKENTSSSAQSPLHRCMDSLSVLSHSGLGHAGVSHPGSSMVDISGDQIGEECTGSEPSTLNMDSSNLSSEAAIPQCIQLSNMGDVGRQERLTGDGYDNLLPHKMAAEEQTMSDKTVILAESQWEDTCRDLPDRASPSDPEKLENGEYMPTNSLCESQASQDGLGLSNAGNDAVLDCQIIDERSPDFEQDLSIDEADFQTDSTSLERPRILGCGSDISLQEASCSVKRQDFPCEENVTSQHVTVLDYLPIGRSIIEAVPVKEKDSEKEDTSTEIQTKSENVSSGFQEHISGNTLETTFDTEKESSPVQIPGRCFDAMLGQ